MTAGLLILALVPAIFACYRRWWLAVRWILVLVVVEGAIRKWVLPGQQQLVYIAKDLLILGVYVGYLNAGRKVRRVRVPLSVLAPLIACAVWGAFEIFNSKLPSLLVGVFGWKAYFWYAPLLWVVPAAFKDLSDFVRFLRKYALLVVPIVVLGLIQFRAPTTSLLNRYAWGEESESNPNIATFGLSSAARVTSTFSYISGYSTFLVVAGIFLLIVLGVRGFRLRGSVVPWISLLSIPIGVLISGSRGPLILLAGMFPLLFLFARGGNAEWSRLLFRLVAATALCAALVSYAAMPALEAFSYRVRSTEEDVVARAFTPLNEPFRMLQSVGPIGYGIGATHQAASSLVPNQRPLSWLDGIEAEVESTRVMIELGPLGFVLHYLYRVTLIAVAFGIARRARIPAGRIVAFGAAYFLLAHLLGAVVFNVYAGIYFWFLAGGALLVRAEEVEANRRIFAAESDPLRVPIAVRGSA